MRDLTLYRAMTATLPSFSLFNNAHSPDPDSTSCIFLEKGHIMEYIQLGARRLVCLFWGPEEYVIRCHPLFSTLKSLDPVATVTFTYRNVIRTLRKFPESSAQYEGIRKQYLEKVTERLRMLNTMTGEERFEHLRSAQPWVFTLAGRQDIAAYLGLATEELRTLVRC